MQIKIEDLVVGQSETKTIFISRELILNFGTLTEDHNPLHSDDDFGKTTPFGQINAQGMLLGALIIGIVGSSLPGRGWMCLGVDSTFNLPVFPGEKIDITVSVKQTVMALGVALLEGEIRKQNGDVAGRSKIKVKQLELTT